MKEAWTHTARMWYDERINLLIVRISNNVEMGIKDIENHYEVVARLTGGNKPYVLSDIRASFSMTPEAKRTAALQSSNRLAIAVVTNKLATRIFMNIFFLFYSHKCPTKLFGTEEKAMHWLRKRGLKDGQ